MRFSPSVLLLFTLLGYVSVSELSNENDRKAQEQDVETKVVNKRISATPVAEPIETPEQLLTGKTRLV